jgi:hypothetical protein
LPQGRIKWCSFRGLHLDDRHVREADGTGLAASIVDLVLYVVHNHERLRAEGRSVVLYLPKIQTAEEAALWNDLLAALEGTWVRQRRSDLVAERRARPAPGAFEARAASPVRRGEGCGAVEAVPRTTDCI